MYNVAGRPTIQLTLIFLGFSDETTRVHYDTQMYIQRVDPMLRLPLIYRTLIPTDTQEDYFRSNIHGTEGGAVQQN